MSEEILAEGRHIRLVRRDGWEYVERPRITGIVTIAAVTSEGWVLLIEQYRPPVGRIVIEMPAGLAGDTPDARGEPLEEAARRELLEETGYRAAEMVYLADGTPSAGLSNEVISFFEARGLERIGKGGGDSSESITVREVPLASVNDWLRERVKAGCVVDLKVYAGLYFLGRGPS